MPDAGHVTILRRELADAARALREAAKREARRLVEAERLAWWRAQDSCFFFDRIRPKADARLEAIRAGEPERFRGERKCAGVLIDDADRADAAYTILSFAILRDRLRYLRGGSEREAVTQETLTRGGVFTAACGGRHFQEIVR